MRSSIDNELSVPPTATTLVALLQTNAASLADKVAFSFLPDHGGDPVSITYRQLHEQALAIGGMLQSLTAPGDRALLLFPPGLDFIAAFFGCLHAGVTAVPVAFPARNRSTAALSAIVKASDPRLILSTDSHCELAQRLCADVPDIANRQWLATDKIDSRFREQWRDLNIAPDQTAFLQFTSGSTSSPKGVILSHDNVLQNAALIQTAFGNTRDSKGVFWLPQYHDMGLIGGVIQPIYCGGSATLLAPAAFLRRPALWLEMISKTGATVSGAPDFAYGLCARKIAPEERANLDLSTWQVAFTGAERVRAETIERFVAAFEPCGFRREAFFPCYGLAEATLMVSGGPRQSPLRVVHVSATALGKNKVADVPADDLTARTLVGCGPCLPGQEIRIVDPQTCQPCAANEVGEIWVRGASVAGGYYGRPDATEAGFHGRLADSGDGPFLRTGDLGFLRDGQLFVAGRLKDVIIIRGRNYYPEDIEHTVEAAHPAFRMRGCVAFAIDGPDRERLVVVQEVEPRLRDVNSEAALSAIRSAVAAEHELEIHAVVLAKAGEIPKTSSGKTQRSACRERFLAGEIDVLAQWTASEELFENENWETQCAPNPRAVSAQEAEQWLMERIAARVGLPAAQISVTASFLEFGMGSLDAVEIAAELETWLARRMPPTAIYNYPNIAALAQWIAKPPLENDSSFAPGLTLAPDGADLDPARLLEDVRNMTDEDMKAFILQEMAKQ